MRYQKLGCHQPKNSKIQETVEDGRPVAVNIAKVPFMVCISLLIASCDDAAERRADCAAFSKIDRAVVEAMCVPWSERRQSALADLIEVVQNEKPSDPIDKDYILDAAREVRAKDCIAAGYKNPGPQPVDPDKEAVRRFVRGTVSRTTPNKKSVSGSAGEMCLRDKIMPLPRAGMSEIFDK